MKVLLSAYCCIPNAGSENAIGWNWALGIAACGHQTIVITRAIHRQAIERAREKDSIQNPRFLFHDMPPTIQKLYNIPFGNYVHYVLWQYTAANVALRVHAQEKFDLVQHITWGNFRFPSFMGRLGVPFIFGPVAGGEDAPKNLRRGLGLRGRVWDSLRRASNLLLTRAPLMRATYKRATQIVVTTNETLREIPAPYRQKVRVQQAVGIDPSGPRVSAERSSTPATGRAKLKLLFAGRLLPWKGLHLGLMALAALGSQSKDVHLAVVGSGSDESRLKRLTRRLDLEHSVSWIPWMDTDDLARLYAEFDLFLFPSLHDSGGMAVLEAMSFGLPVLCLDLGGPGISVDDTCGRVIRTRDHTEEELAQLISACLSEFLLDPSILKPLSVGARRRVASFSWQATVANTYCQPLVQQLAHDRTAEVITC